MQCCLSPSLLFLLGHPLTTLPSLDLCLPPAISACLGLSQLSTQPQGHAPSFGSTLLISICGQVSEAKSPSVSTSSCTNVGSHCTSLLALVKATTLILESKDLLFPGLFQKNSPLPQIWGPQPSLCYLCSWIGFFLHLPFKSESSQLAPSAASHSPTPGSDRSILMPLEEGLIKPMLEPKAWHIPCGTQWEMKVRSSPSKN